jgi:hypothetical protein
MMAIYQIVPGTMTGFTAKVTYRDGRIETERGFLTNDAALDWIAGRLVSDIGPSREA